MHEMGAYPQAYGEAVLALWRRTKMNCLTMMEKWFPYQDALPLTVASNILSQLSGEPRIPTIETLLEGITVCMLDPEKVP